MVVKIPPCGGLTKARDQDWKWRNTFKKCYSTRNQTHTPVEMGWSAEHIRKPESQGSGKTTWGGRLPLGASGLPHLSGPRTAAPAPAHTLLGPAPSRRAAHPDALQHPDPLLLIHLEGHPSGLGALGAAHDRRRAGRTATRAGSTATRTTPLRALRSSLGTQASNTAFYWLLLLARVALWEL